MPLETLWESIANTLSYRLKRSGKHIASQSVSSVLQDRFTEPQLSSKNRDFSPLFHDGSSKPQFYMSLTDY